MINLRLLAPALCELDEGIYGTRDVADVSYPQDGHDGCCAIEDASFWFAHRNAVLLDTLQRFPPNGLILDVGGGNGHVTLALLNAGYGAVLLEPGAAGVANARARGVAPIVHTTFEQAQFHRESLPAAGLFDVLEHVKDDDAFLRQLGQALESGGYLYLTVPAFGWLWSHADVRAGHYRRYSRRTLVRVLNRAGFDVVYVTCFFAFLAAPIWFAKSLPDKVRPPVRDRQRQAEREHEPPRLARAVLDALGRSEQRWLATGRVVPVGSSILAVARRA